MSKPSNKICPRCGKGGYINYIGQSNIYEAKCYNCGYYFAFGELDLYEEKKPVTNADRIRQMTDVELADWVWGAETAGRAYGPRGKASWLRWLKQEVDECGWR